MSYIKEDFIKKAKNIYDDRYDYSKVDFVNMTTKVCIICPEHGEFWQKPSVHIHGNGCKKCGSNSSSNKNRLTKGEFIEKSRKVHGDKYDYSKVEYKNCKTKVCIICPIHGEFWQTPMGHIRGNGCKKCNGGVMKYTSAEFIEEIKKIFGDKYDYTKVNYVNNKTKICIICHKHGDFLMLPEKLMNGNECPLCMQEKKMIEKFNKKHNNKFDYSKVIYVNANTKVCIICPEHGEFWQTPLNHLKNNIACPRCVDEHISSCIEKNKKHMYNILYNIAQKYTNVADFRTMDKKAYYKAKIRGWLKDFTWLKQEDETVSNAKTQTVYVYEFLDNYAYIGLTNNLHSRDLSHRRENKWHGKVKYDGVYNHYKETGIEIPKVKILESGLTRSESQIKEEKWKNYYKECGWYIINKVKCGSLGRGIHHIYTEEELKCICKKYKNMEQLRKNNRKIYNFIIKNKMQNILFEGKIQKHKEKREYTEEYIQELINKFPTKNDIRKNDITAYKYLYTHGLLYKYYPKGWVDRDRER